MRQLHIITVRMTLIVLCALLVMVGAHAQTHNSTELIQETAVVITEENMTMVMVLFNDDMEERTINERTFIVEAHSPTMFGGFERTSQPGIVSYNNRTATFTFSENPLSNATYVATLTTDVQDMQGNSFEEPYTWNVTVADATRAATVPAEQGTNDSAIAPVFTPGGQQGAQAASTTTNVLYWILVGSGVLLVAFLIFVFLMQRNAATDYGDDSEDDLMDGTTSKLTGDTYPIDVMQGIGATHAQELHKMGIHDTKQLWQADAGYVAQILGVPKRTAMHWQHVAQLASVSGIGPENAHLLDQSGIHSVQELTSHTPHTLLKAVRETRPGNVEGYAIERQTAQHWIDEARTQQGESA